MTTLNTTQAVKDISSLCSEIIERLEKGADVKETFKKVAEQYGEDVALNMQIIINDFLEKSNEEGIRKLNK